MTALVDVVHVSVVDHHRKRGELRIYLGAAPGVGKTYAMLAEAHRRLERGTDLVAAVVETYGRRKVAELLEGIELIPRRTIEYRGTQFTELDVPAVLARNQASPASFPSIVASPRAGALVQPEASSHPVCRKCISELASDQLH